MLQENWARAQLKLGLSSMDQAHTIRPPTRTHDMVSSSAIVLQKLTERQNQKRKEFSFSYLD
jgi:hypothetical protein